MKFYDTNALLNLGEKAFTEKFAIADITLRELESIKTNRNKDEEVKHKARKVAHLLDEHSDMIVVFPTKKEDYDYPDEGIVKAADALNYSIQNGAYNASDLQFVTDDICCKLLAKNIYNLPVEGVTDTSFDPYTGFKEITMDDEEMALFYSNLCENRYNLLTNQYLIIKNTNGEVIDKYRWDGEEHKGLWHKDIKSMYFDKLKSKDVYQACAVDSIMSNTLTAISGKAGSGKSLLSLMVAMNLIERGVYDRIVVLFNPTKTRGAADSGYFPGDNVCKAMSNFIGNVLTTKFGDRYAVDILISQNKLKLVSMADARGMEILDNEILWITEAQNTSVDLIKLCLSRMSSGAKAIIEGDYDSQLDNKAFEGSNNGLRRIITAFKGQKEFGYVQLQNVWRSRIAQLCELL